MNKKIKGNEILNLHKAQFPLKQIIVTSNSGQEFHVQIQSKLNETTIMNLVCDLVERSDYCTKNNIEFNEILNTYVLLLKYFTDIDFGNYKSIKKQYENELKIVNVLIDFSLFKQIISNFDAETMSKIQDSLNTYSKQLKIVTNNKLKEILEDEYQAKVEIENEE